MSPAVSSATDVAGELGRLVEISSDLREAMLERNPEKIMEAVSRGEELHMSPALMAATPRLLEDEEVGDLARRLRRLQESNRLLASSFLKVYRQILKPSRGEAREDAGLYGRSGLVQAPAATPLLIHQIG
jgi:hypothetical protein